MESSVFKEFAIGVVAENKALGSNIISVVLPKEMSFMDGSIKENVVVQEYSGVNGDGDHYNGTLSTDMTINAKWLPGGANRVTPPDVRRGMRVKLFKTGEGFENVYWRYEGLDDHLMKLETVVFAISSSTDMSNDSVDVNNSYFVEFSSHKKHLIIHTTQNNGEPYEYTIKLDMGEGNLTIKDNVSNEVNLDSNRNYIQLLNGTGNNFEMDGKDTKLTIPGDLDAKVSGKVDVEAGGDITFKTGGTTLVLSGGGTTLTTPSFKGNS